MIYLACIYVADFAQVAVKNVPKKHQIISHNIKNGMFEPNCDYCISSGKTNVRVIIL